jgi:hypothetical protein
MEFSIDKFNEVKREAEQFYENTKSTYCPYFGEKINFNSKGWEHLIFKEWNKTRTIEDQFSRFRHIKLAPKILEQSKTLQGFLSTQKFERVKKKDGKWVQLLKQTSYYEFIAILESHGSKVRVKVIIKQTEGGEKFFLSIIPYWKTDKSGNRIMYGGNPEND